MKYSIKGEGQGAVYGRNDRNMYGNNVNYM